MQSPAAQPLRVALGEYDIGWHDPERSLGRARSLVADAAAAGAQLVVLPEMATTGFTMDRSQATPLEGGHSALLAEIAAESEVWLIASVAATERETSGSPAAKSRPVNAAVVIDPRGAIKAVYRKQKLFAFAGEHEHYAPGTDRVVVDIEGVRIAPLVCYDLRFPELFRAVARQVDAFVLVANWPASRRLHWDTLSRARAIENQAYVVAVNRIGQGGNLDYDGGSIAWTPWGDRAPETTSANGVRIATIDPGLVSEIRGKFPFLRDLALDCK
jgi:predicted amidohydrolase